MNRQAQDNDRRSVVFIIEDHTIVRHSLETLVSSFGYRVRSFESADAYLASSHEEKPDCLVLDFRLPGTDGLQLFDQLAAQHVTVPLVFLTADFSDELRSEAAKRGIAEVLEKPCSAAALREKIDQAIATNANPGDDR